MAIKQYQNYFFVPILLEELVTATKNTIPNDPRCITESGLNIDYISIIGCVKNKIMQHKKTTNNKPTDEVVPNNFVIGDENINISVFPYPHDLDTQEAIGSLLEGDYVHIDGIYGFYNDKAKITVLNIRRIPDNPLLYLNVWYIKMLKQRIGEKIPMHSSMYTHFIKEQYGQYGKVDGNFFIFQGFPNTVQFTSKAEVPKVDQPVPTKKNIEDEQIEEELMLSKAEADSEKINVADVISSPKRKKSQKQEVSQPIQASTSASSLSEDQVIAYLVKEADIPKEKILKLREKLGSFEKVAETLDIPLPKINPLPKSVTPTTSPEPSGDIESLCLNYLAQSKQKCTVSNVTAALKIAQSKVLSVLIKMVKANKILQTYAEDGNALFYIQ